MNREWDLNHLKYFYYVAVEGSLTKAAKKLRVQQPTISKVIKLLEKELSIKLFERSPLGVKLTAHGKEVFKLCKDIFEQVDSIQELSQDLQKGYKGPLSLGLTDSVATHIMPKLMKGFLKTFPETEASLFAGTYNLICQEILEDRIELGICFTTPNLRVFESRSLVKIPFELVCAPEIYNEKSPLKTVEHGFVISREIDYPTTRPFPVLEMLQDHGLQVNVAISCNNLDAQRRLVREGLGVALLPQFLVAADLRYGRLKNISMEETFFYSLKLITKKRKKLSPLAQSFLEHFTKYFSEGNT